MVFMHWQKVSLPFKSWLCSVCGVLPWILQDMEGWTHRSASAVPVSLTGHAAPSALG